MTLILAMTFQIQHQKHYGERKKSVNLISLKVKTSAQWKTLLREWKDNPWKKFAKHISDKRLYPKYIKELLKLTDIKIKNPI